MQRKDFARVVKKNLYIIAGCNGAGKTTASITFLPDVINCKEFVNADAIAAGLSPFDAEKYAFEAGRLMLKRMDQLMENGLEFAIETTLSSKTYISRIRRAKALGYRVYLFFFWLDRVELAIRRVRKRVKMGGHSIPLDTIKRRYIRGVANFFELYQREVDYWVILNNSQKEAFLVMEGEGRATTKIYREDEWKKLMEQYKKSIA